MCLPSGCASYATALRPITATMRSRAAATAGGRRCAERLTGETFTRARARSTRRRPAVPMQPMLVREAVAPVRRRCGRHPDHAEWSHDVVANVVSLLVWRWDVRGFGGDLGVPRPSGACTIRCQARPRSGSRRSLRTQSDGPVRGKKQRTSHVETLLRATARSTSSSHLRATPRLRGTTTTSEYRESRGTINFYFTHVFIVSQVMPLLLRHAASAACGVCAHRCQRLPTIRVGTRQRGSLLALPTAARGAGPVGGRVPASIQVLAAARLVAAVAPAAEAAAVWQPVAAAAGF